MTAVVRVTSSKQWSNWHGNVKRPVRKLVDVWNGNPDISSAGEYNSATQALQGLIAEAIAVGTGLRAVGGAWALSEVAATTGIAVNTRPLNYKFHFSRDQLDPAYTQPSANLLFAQCGNSIAGLNAYLLSRSQCLHTSGASNGQTIAGAMSTGTHGAAIDFGSVVDFVRGVHVVTSPTESVWVEAASRPVLRQQTSQAFASRVIRDDALFDAVRVNLGGLGLVHGVLLEASDQYFLHGYRRRVQDTAQVLDALDQFDLSALNLPRQQARPYHLQIVLNPFDVQGGAHVTSMYREETQTGQCRPPVPSLIVQGDSALEVIGALTDYDPRLTASTLKKLLGLAYPEFSDVCGPPGHIFRDTTTRGAVASTAMGIALGNVRQAVERVASIIRSEGAPALIALRLVRSTAAGLCVAGHPDRTCILEVDGPNSARMRAAQQRMWSELDVAGVPYRFHWGKMHGITPATLPGRLRQAEIMGWRSARSQLLTEEGVASAFSSPSLLQTGLEV